MIDGRKVLHLTGETIREIGILVVVFAPLDALFQMDALPLPLLGSLMSLALLLILTGIMLEADD